MTKAKLSEKIGYGFGDMSSSMFWKIFSYYLPFFYSNIFGLSLAHAGTLLLVTKLYDAISDPVMDQHEMGQIPSLSAVDCAAFRDSRHPCVLYASD